MIASVKSGKPSILFSPLRYVVSAGGKRLRALLTLICCEAVGGRADRAMGAAVAIECLHNFTLIHDDLMDESPVRRGRPTVHTRWNDNVAILAGDQLLALAYGALLRGGRTTTPPVFRVFTRAYRDVCEGQGYDMEFESRKRVTMKQYRTMIEKKTARIIAAAAEIGAMIGGGSRREIAALRTYGIRVGMAFQIRDDVLDVTGTTKDFGKKIGGDISRGKKTFLLVKALEGSYGADRRILAAVSSGTGRARAALGKVTDIYFRSGAIDAARREIGRLTAGAMRSIGVLEDSAPKAALLGIAGRLADRNV